MSEMPFFGRNPIYLGTLLVFVCLQPAVIYAKKFGMLLAFRFITGFVSSPVLATGGASISGACLASYEAQHLTVSQICMRRTSARTVYQFGVSRLY